MRNTHYTEIKNYKIYAILLSAEDNFCFVGKTASHRLSAVYHRHRRGEVAATEGFFSQKDEHPQLYLLEELPLSNAQAYKRVLAWIYIFMTNEYSLINHSRSVAQVKNLKADTAHIVEELQKEPLEKILQQTIVMHPTDADTRPEPHNLEQKKEKSCTLSIRLKESDKKQFLNFCQGKRLTQKQGFSLLLDYATNNTSTKQLDSILAEKDAHICKLESESKAIQTKKVEKAVQKELKSYFAFLKEGINLYLGELFPSDVTAEPLQTTSYRRYMRLKDPSIEYVYPQTEGFACIKLQALLWGMSRKRALFILGITENGTHIRLRYYPKDEYLGYPLCGCPYAYKNARWLVGFQTAQDGAMDLVAAFPLIPWETGKINCDEENKQEVFVPKKTLDRQIKDAQHRNRQSHNT